MASVSKRWSIDVPVAINFFARPNEFKKAFEVISRVKPRQLFLISDGPRKGNDSDVVAVSQCRKIAESVDWECEVYRFYNEENKGLFDTYFDSMEKVFAIVDRCIFLEDDLIPSESFFEFCRELLIKYENDPRVHFITGMNVLGEYADPTSDYFFSGEGSIWGYALWRRTFESLNCDFLDDDYVVRCSVDVAKQIKPGYEKRILKTKNNMMWEGHIPHVEFYKNVLRATQNQVYIVPTKNLISNIGLSSNSVHSANSVSKLPKVTQQLFFQPTYDYDFPLTHPRYMVRDLRYENEVNYILGWNMPIRRFLRRIEALLRHLRYGDFGRVKSKLLLFAQGKHIE